LSHVDDKGTQIYPSWAYECAFAAKHAFLELLFQLVILSSAEIAVRFADVEVGELPCRTGCCAAAATDASLEGWN